MEKKKRKKKRANCLLPGGKRKEGSRNKHGDKVKRATVGREKRDGPTSLNHGQKKEKRT